MRIRTPRLAATRLPRGVSREEQSMCYVSSIELISREKGKKEGLREVLYEILERKVGDNLPPWAMAQIENGSVETLRRWTLNAVFHDDLDLILS